MMTSKNLKVLSKDELKSVFAGIEPDCEGGTRTVVDGIVICEYYDIDPTNTDNLDDCLMGF